MRRRGENGLRCLRAGGCVAVAVGLAECVYGAAIGAFDPVCLSGVAAIVAGIACLLTH